jgi:hypothetical protein
MSTMRQIAMVAATHCEGSRCCGFASSSEVPAIVASDPALSLLKLPLPPLFAKQMHVSKLGKFR